MTSAATVVESGGAERRAVRLPHASRVICARMDFRPDKIQQAVVRLDEQLAAITSHMGDAHRPAVERWRADAAALRFHLSRRPSNRPLLVAIIGGTGTGKSTIVNR